MIQRNRQADEIRQIYCLLNTRLVKKSYITVFVTNYTLGLDTSVTADFIVPHSKGKTYNVDCCNQQAASAMTQKMSLVKFTFRMSHYRAKINLQKLTR